MLPVHTYTDEEIAIVKEDFADGALPGVTAERLNALPSNAGHTRTAKGIRELRVRLGLRRRERINVVRAEVNASTRDDDLAFQMTLMLAIRRGQEHARRGVSKNDTPLVGKFIPSPPIFSGCTSAASLCADMAIDDQGRGGDLGRP